MTPEVAAEMCQASVLLALTIVAPVLLAAIASSLIVGLLQAVTQLHDQTLSFVPKLVVMSLVMLKAIAADERRLRDLGNI